MFSMLKMDFYTFFRIFYSCLLKSTDFLCIVEVSPGWQDVSGIRSICHDYQAYRLEVGAWLKSLSNRKVKHFQRFIPRILVDEPHYTDFSGCQTEV